MTNKVLVLMTTYNGGPFVIEQINSVLKQKGVEVDILISDDSSQEETIEILESYSKNNNIQIIYNEKSSGSASANYFRLFKSCDIGNYDYIALSDQDDIWLDSKLLTATKIIEKTGVCGYSSAVTAYWDENNKRTIGQNNTVVELDYIFEGAGQGCTFVIKPKLFKLVIESMNITQSLIRDFHYHDWYIYIISRINDYGWYFDKNSHIYYRQHAENDTGIRSGLSGIKHRISLIWNGWYTKQILLAIKISKRLEHEDPNLSRFIKNINNNNRIGISKDILFQSRRRKIDRLIVFIFNLIGLIKLSQ